MSHYMEANVGPIKISVFLLLMSSALYDANKYKVEDPAVVVLGD